jgi:hypothetical protein
MTDLVWVELEAAVRAGLDDKGVLDDPPKTDEDVMWLAATITDHVSGALPKEVCALFRTSLMRGSSPSSS